MRKFGILFAMVFTVSMVMAQKTTWVTQSGFGNVANVTQSACVSLDAVALYANQSGTWNTLNVDQAGSDNYIELYQSGANNTADMTQLTCNINNPGPAAYGNDADVYQSGNSNSASLIQKEDDTDGWDYSQNNANAIQSGNNNAYTLVQGTVKWQPVNAQSLVQSGTGNSADIDQTGFSSDSEIRQPGDWNTADLDQSGPSGIGSAYTKSYSWQVGGSNNLVDIGQTGNPGLQYANSVQDGTSNTTNVYQSSWAVQQVVSSQDGSGDIINVTQVN